MGLHLKALRATGVPYTDEQIAAAREDARGQADPDSEAAEGVVIERYGEGIAIRDFAGDGPGVSEMDALVAYLQMLGTLVDFETFQVSRQERGVTDDRDLSRCARLFLQVMGSVLPHRRCPSPS